MTDDADEPKPGSRPQGGPRPPKPLGAAYLERAALAYLERYATSAENLRRVLARKARRRDAGELPATAVAELIAAVVDKVVRSGLVDDRLFAATRVATLARRGTSRRGIAARLGAKGVSVDGVGAALEEAELDDLALARRFAERRRLGPWRPRERDRYRERDLAALCRQGFSYGIARAALDTAADEPEP